MEPEARDILIEDMIDLLRDLLPMVEDWAGGEDDDGEGMMPATAMLKRIAAILNRIDGKS